MSEQKALCMKRIPESGESCQLEPGHSGRHEPTPQEGQNGGRYFTALIADLTSYAYDDGRSFFSLTRSEALQIARNCAEIQDPLKERPEALGE